MRGEYSILGLGNARDIVPKHHVVIGLFCGLTLLTTLTLVPNVYDAPRNSMMLSLNYIVALGTITLIFKKVNSIKITTIDILFIASILLDTLYFPININSLSVVTKFSLLGLYVILRRLDNQFIEIGLSICGPLGLCILNVIGYLQFLDYIQETNYHFPVTGSYYNPSLYASMVGIFLLITFICAKITKSLIYRQVTITLLIITLPVLFIAESRTVFLALFVTAGVAYFPSLKQWFITKSPLLKYSFCFILSFTLVLLLFKLYDLRPDSIKGRLLIWKVGARMVQDASIFGQGSGSFQANYMHYQARYFLNTDDSEGKMLASNNYLAFCEPLRILYEQGIVGLFVFAYITYILYNRTNYRERESIAVRLPLIFFFTCCMFSYPFHNYPMMTWVTVLFAYISNCCLSKKIIKVRTREHVTKPLIGAGIIAAAIINVKYHINYFKFERIIHSSKKIHLSNLRNQLSVLQPNLRVDLGFLFTYATVLYENHNYDACVDIINHAIKLYPFNELFILRADCLMKMGCPRMQIESDYQYASAMIPVRQRARVRLALLYKKYGEKEKALLLAKEILSEQVKVYGFSTYELHKSLKKEFNIQ